MKPRLIVIRHSERLDEVDEGAWKKLVLKQKTDGGRRSFASDPVISPKQGCQIAEMMAATVKNMIESDTTQGLVVCLYASRLLRAVQTASYIGRALHIPGHVSAGLAQIIPAVKSKQGAFEFATVQELAHCCPSTEIVDCDDPRGSNHLPMNSWKAALNTILARSDSNVLNIVVAHHETVRKLVGKHVQTPYCCLGLFHVSFGEDPQSVDETHEAESKPIMVDRICGSNDSKCPVPDTPASVHAETKVLDTKVVAKAEGKAGIKGTTSAKAGSSAKATVNKKTDSISAAKRDSAAASKSVPKVYTHVDSIVFLAVLDRDGTVVCEKPH